MAKTDISDELKEAILDLSSKEKDKLLIRLIKKDDLLVEQLQFKLLEGTASDLEYRKSEIKESIDLRFISKYISSFEDLLYYSRIRITEINRYAKVTKDKQGELELLIHILKKAIPLIQNFPQPLTISQTARHHGFKIKYKEYAEKRISKSETLLNSLHEDYRIEFVDDLEMITEFISSL